MAARAGNEIGVRIGQSSGLSLVRTPTPRTVAGEGVQLAVRCRGQVVAAVTGVDAGDEDHEYGDYRAG